MHTKRLSFISLHKKWSFPLSISSVNVTKSAVFYGFGHIYWRNPYWKNSFFVQCLRVYISWKYHFKSSTCHDALWYLFTVTRYMLWGHMRESIPGNIPINVQMKCYKRMFYKASGYKAKVKREEGEIPLRYSHTNYIITNIWLLQHK